MENTNFLPNIPENTIYHVGVSGGKDSTAVLLWMVYESGIPLHKIDVSFCDTGNEHEDTYGQILFLDTFIHHVKTIQPKLSFYDLVLKKNLFPTNSRRFCTDHLKIQPAKQYITGLLAAAEKVVMVSGVRSNESDKRANLEEWTYSDSLLILEWRPILRWTIDDVLNIHKKYNVPLNPLYEKGARRVGCFPCIYSRKSEIRLISQISPERIEKISALEKKIGKTFFHRNTIPERFHTEVFITKDNTQYSACNINDVVNWSKTGKRAKGSYLDDAPEPITCVSGFCE